MLALLSSVLLVAAFVKANDNPDHNSLSDNFSRLGVSDIFNAVSSCGTKGPASCHGSDTAGSCCYESPGGLLAQVQFWDTNPATGPADNWTIHGLWPDHCDGTYKVNCDKSRHYTNLGSIFDNAGRSDLREFLSKWMLPNNESPEKFWQHEWNNHGTCVTTLSPKCLPSGSARGTEAVYYFSRIASLFQTLPTHEWLAKHDINPTGDRTYTIDEFTNAIQAEWGYAPAMDCNKDGEIYEIYYYFNLKGSMIDGEFVPRGTLLRKFPR
ncbi:ribonuclease T2 [Clavulina sp. PMI_390]|nr:ribonuclease T2 [Clavulina sp. PMI_390]